MLQFSPADVERARTRFDIVAAEVALKRRGRELVGLCPFHNERTPSFAIVPHKVFMHCHGCGWHGTVVDFVMQRRNVSFFDAMRILLNLPSLPPKEDHAPRAARRDDDRSDAVADARAIWAESSTIDRRLVRLYLDSRYLRRDIPDAIREHPALYCPERHAKMPALVAAFHNSRGDLTAVQRIWLEHKFVTVGGDGGDPKGSRLKNVPKKSRGVLGDGAVRLAPPGPFLGFAEGIETALAAQHLHRIPVWALGGLARLGYPEHRDQHTGKLIAERPPTVWVPPEVQHIVLFGDANEIGQIVAEFAAGWWRRQKRSAEAIMPDFGFGDFQDQLRVAVLAGAVR